jgi:galactokinase
MSSGVYGARSYATRPVQTSERGEVRGRLPARLERARRPGWDRAFRAPGRANLIGEHTDYNDGFVLPVALEMSTYVAGREVESEVRLRSLDFDDEVVTEAGAGQGPERGWGAYVTGVVRALEDQGIAVHGFVGAIASEVPMGAGLSSSAALEVAVASALVDDAIDEPTLARVCQRAENVYVGVQCGIMDQLAATSGRDGHALFIDCRSLAIEAVPVPDGLTVLLIDSAVQRELGDSGYNERRAQCEEAARVLGVRALRDASMGMLEEAGDELDGLVLRRARHVIGDNERVVEAVAALRNDDRDALGHLFAASHESYARDYEASTPEIDALVDIAASTPGVVAARLTGGGFGGCTVNLVERYRAGAVADAIVDGYRTRTGHQARHWISRPAAGAGRLTVG